MSGNFARLPDLAPSGAMRKVLKDLAGGLAGIKAVIDQRSQCAGRRSPSKLAQCPAPMLNLGQPILQRNA
jgi:hypothetical protein